MHSYRPRCGLHTEWCTELKKTRYTRCIQIRHQAAMLDHGLRTENTLACQWAHDLNFFNDLTRCDREKIAKLQGSHVCNELKIKGGMCSKISVCVICGTNNMPPSLQALLAFLVSCMANYRRSCQEHRTCTGHRVLTLKNHTSLHHWTQFPILSYYPLSLFL